MSAEACFRLPCARCGGPVSALEGATTLVCPHCRAAFFLDPDGAAGWLLEPELRPRDAVLPAKRYLREEGIRVTALDEPVGVLAPLYWIRGLCLVWELRDPARSAPRMGGAGAPTAGDVWEGRSAVQARNHALPGHALAGAWRGGGVRLGSRPLTLLDPDSLPRDYRLIPPHVAVDTAAEQASAWREGAQRRRPDDPDWHRGEAVLQRRLNLVSVPLILVPYRFRGEPASAVVVDAVSGRGLGTVSPEALASLPDPDSPEAPVPATSDRVLIPLDCAECGWELDPDERDRLHPCPNCGLCWEWRDGERRRIRQWFHEGDPGEQGRWLPFWVFGEGGGESPPTDAVYVPAYEARHLEAQLWLAVGLTRTPPEGPWLDHRQKALHGARHGTDEAAGWLWGVRGALARANFAEFVRFLREPQSRPHPAGLAWLPFRREAGDLVEITSGARTRAHGAVPWQRRRAA